MESNSINHVTNQCKICQQVKPVNEFYHHKRNNRPEANCKKCRYLLYTQNATLKILSQDKTKQCQACGLVKPLSSFNYNHTMPDKATVRCSECINSGKVIAKEFQTVSPLSHMTELRKRLVLVTNLIRQKEQAMAKPKRITDEFMAEYKKLNLLRIEKATIESRIRTKEVNPQSLAILPVSLSNF